MAKNLGDGALVYFGYPHAQENDAERALRAGLALVDAVAAQSRSVTTPNAPKLAVRVGIHAGPIVLSPDGELYGEVPNVAARVQALTEPGTVLITGDVHRLVSGLFVVSDRGPQMLKGVRASVTLFQVMRASGVGNRRVSGPGDDAARGAARRLRTIERCWERARAGQGQFVMLVGEAGLGKSGLTDEFQSRIADAPHTWIEFACSQLLQNTPFQPRETSHLRTGRAIRFIRRSSSSNADWRNRDDAGSSCRLPRGLASRGGLRAGAIGAFGRTAPGTAGPRRLSAAAGVSRRAAAQTHRTLVAWITGAPARSLSCYTSTISLGRSVHPRSVRVPWPSKAPRSRSWC